MPHRPGKFPFEPALLGLALTGLALLLVAPPALRAAAQPWPTAPSESRGDDDDNYTYARIVRLSLVDGDVQVLRTSTEDDSTPQWEQALLNLPIRQGFRLATGYGRAEIEFESGATARISDNTVLEFTELALDNGGRITRLALTQGTATFYAKLDRRDIFSVQTPHFTVSIPDDARFRVDAGDTGSSVRVFKGDVDVDSQAGMNRVGKGRMLSVSATETDRVELARAGDSDAWDKWVADRDEVVPSVTSAQLQYVGSPYQYGLYDLYTYGSWYNIGGYGHCWRPYGVGLGWHPFSCGRWLFLSGWGWNWVSCEPWGWLPYRYGGWFFSPVHGWLWVPGRFNHWRPTFVHWVRVRDRIGWVPPHPRDRRGHTPDNLPHGAVFTNRRGPIATTLERVRITDARLFTPDAPDRLDHSVDRSVIGLRPADRSRVGGNEGRGGIRFDPNERRWVNDAAPPSMGPPQTMPAPRRGNEGIRRAEDADRGSGRPEKVPAMGPSGKGAGATPTRPQVPAGIGPRTDSPRGTPPPMTPRVQPPSQPRVSTPPPSSAPPRVSPPPSSPPPRSSPPPSAGPPPRPSGPPPSPSRNAPRPAPNPN